MKLSDFLFESPLDLLFRKRFEVKLPQNTRGVDVQDLQKALEALGYSVGPPGDDGIIGPYTRNAINKYQKDHELEITANPTIPMVTSINDELQKHPELLKKLVPSTAKELNTPKSGSKLKPLAQDAVTKGKVGSLLNFIARYESGGNYNVVFGGEVIPNLTDMTINEVYKLQNSMRMKGKKSTAVGRYQFIQGTLKECVNGLGLDINTATFSPKLQDDLIIYRLRSMRKLDSWLDGSLPTDKFLRNLAFEFASLPTPGTGQSAYAGDNLNVAGTNLDTALTTLDNIKNA